MNAVPSSSAPLGAMPTIPCAFCGNVHRIDICERDAVMFFRTARGTIWPFCRPCAERHKDTAVQLVADSRVEVMAAVGATFDIPLDDPEALEAFKNQDPHRILRVLQSADAVFKRKP